MEEQIAEVILMAYYVVIDNIASVKRPVIKNKTGVGDTVQMTSKDLLLFDANSLMDLVKVEEVLYDVFVFGDVLAIDDSYLLDCLLISDMHRVFSGKKRHTIRPYFQITFVKIFI